MASDERIQLVATCGIDCGICELNMCKDDPQLLSYLVSRGIPNEKLPCAGCRSIEGGCPVIGAQCATYACASKKGVDFCYRCAEFPCAKLQPCADRADILPHNTKVFNLCTIKRIGAEGFVKISQGIKERYYKGKMEIGKGPGLST